MVRVATALKQTVIQKFNQKSVVAFVASLFVVAFAAGMYVVSALAPSAPTDLTGQGGDGVVTLEWTAPETSGDSAVVDYIIEYTESGEENWIEFEDAVTDETEAEVTGLTNGTAYDFRVFAVNTDEEDNVSDPSEPTTVTPFTVPDAPTDVSAVRGNGEATVSFTAPESDGGSEITQYTVTSSPGGFKASGAGSPLVVTGLTNGEEYTFTVVATNEAGDSVASSPSNAVTPATVPDAPTDVSAVRGNGEATVSFTAPESDGGSEITEYTVTSSPGGFTATGATSPITVTGLENGTAYTFTVTATNAAGEGPASSASEAVTPATTPNAPANLVGTPTSGQVALTWDAPASNGGLEITDYVVEYSVSEEDDWTIFADGTSATTGATVTDLTNGTAYDFRVSAVNAVGQGAASVVATSTPRTVPGAPTIGTVTPGDEQVTVAFTPPAFDGGAEITEYTVTSSPGGITANGATSPITVTGLDNGTPYTFTVTATNAAGSGLASSASSAVTPRTVPGAPTDVTATAGDTSATVSFTAPESDGGAEITGYTVTSSPGGITANGSSSPIIVNGLTNGVSYTFTVTATNEAGTGAASSPSSAVTPYTVPGAPTGVTATPGNGQATVSFTAPVSDGGSEITQYTVTSSPGSFTASGAASPITVTGLENGTAYTFTVTATNEAGTGAASSPSSAVTPYTVPGAPTGVTATPGNGQATVSFTAPASNGGSAITGYTVTSSPGSFIASGATSPITVTGLTNGEEYTFTVVATNAAGDGPASDESAAVVPLAAPDEPTDLVATPGNGQVELSWTESSGNGSEVTDYVVEWSVSGENDWTIFSDGTSADTAATVTGLTNGTAYDFRVSAVNAAGQGLASELATTTPRTVPGAPTELVATVGNTQIGLIWNAPVSNGGSAITDYVVEYSVSGENDWTIFSDGASTTPSATVTGLENDTAYDFRVSAVNAAGVGSASMVVSATPVLPTTVISEIHAEPTDTSAVITWKTDLGASSQVEYGPSGSFGTLTPVTDDEDERPISHEVALGDLIPCTTYVFRVISQPEDGAVTTSGNSYFTTEGCVGDAEVVEEIIETVTTAGGSAKLDNDTSGVASLTLTFPAGSTDEDVVVQIKRLDVFPEDVTGKPGSSLLVSNGQVYEIKVITDDGTLVTDFNQPVAIAIKYTNADIKELDESSLKLYNWHDGTWNALSDCVVDAANNTITCTTVQFSLFALFGSAKQTVKPPVNGGTNTNTKTNTNQQGDNSGIAVNDNEEDVTEEEEPAAEDVVEEDIDLQPAPRTTNKEDGDNKEIEQNSAVWWIAGVLAGAVIFMMIIARVRQSREG